MTSYNEMYGELKSVIEKYPFFRNLSIEQMLKSCKNDLEEKSVLENYYKSFMALRNYHASRTQTHYKNHEDNELD